MPEDKKTQKSSTPSKESSAEEKKEEKSSTEESTEDSIKESKVVQLSTDVEKDKDPSTKEGTEKKPEVEKDEEKKPEVEKAEEKKPVTLDERIDEMTVESLKVRESVIITVSDSKSESETETKTETEATEEVKTGAVSQVESVTDSKAWTVLSAHKTLLAGIAGVIIGALITYYAIHGGFPGGQGAAVILIDGNEISQSDYNEVYAQMLITAERSGQDISDEVVLDNLRLQSIDIMISSEVLVLAARASGFSTTAEEIDLQYAQIVEQAGGEETMKQLIDDNDITEKSLRENIERQIIIDVYLLSVIDEVQFAVTDEEITEALAAINFDETGGISLENIRPQIEAQLVNTKQQQAIQDHINGLRTLAEIEVLI